MASIVFAGKICSRHAGLRRETAKISARSSGAYIAEFYGAFVVDFYLSRVYGRLMGLAVLCPRSEPRNLVDGAALTIP